MRYVLLGYVHAVGDPDRHRRCVRECRGTHARNPVSGITHKATRGIRPLGLPLARAESFGITAWMSFEAEMAVVAST